MPGLGVVRALGSSRSGALGVTWARGAWAHSFKLRTALGPRDGWPLLGRRGSAQAALKTAVLVGAVKLKLQLAQLSKRAQSQQVYNTS